MCPKLINPAEIIYLKGDVNYTIFYLECGKKVVSAYTLKYFQNRENMHKFLRVSKAYLLNPAFIESSKNNGKNIIIQMQNGCEMQVSRRRRRLVSV